MYVIAKNNPLALAILHLFDGRYIGGICGKALSLE
jgi:hypothetical protein